MTSPDGRSLAKHIKVVRSRDEALIYVDGVLFPWLTGEGWQVEISKSSLPGLTFTLVCEEIEVAHSLGRTRPERDPDLPLEPVLVEEFIDPITYA